ncbi:MAG: PepSY domain-containing protein [Pseudomonadales bacterium]|nr:PepSY domain-containing protein [Pseudomonadales bacterium]
MLKESSQKLLRKIHKKIGVFFSLFLILLAVTGILLNHTETLQLNKHTVPAAVAARYYDSGEAVFGYQLLGQYYYTLSGFLYQDQLTLGPCEQLQGVASSAGGLQALCAGELLIFTDQQQLVERLGSVHGLPANISRLGVYNGGLLLESNLGVVGLNLESLEIASVDLPEANWPVLVKVPTVAMLDNSIQWQQFILDLHSGAYLGEMGKLLVDIVGVFVIGIIISGLVMWRNPR